jgi:hypothetical protein
MRFESMALLSPLDLKLDRGPRADVTNRLFKILHEEEKHAWVHGPRHAGKAALGTAVQEKLREVGDVVLRLELARALPEQTHADPQKWSRALADSIRKLIRDVHKASDPAPESTRGASDAVEWLKEAFDELFEALNKSNPKGTDAPKKLVLFIDDIDVAAWLTEGHLLVSFLHLLADESLKRNLVLCVFSILRPSDLRMLLKPPLVASPSREDGLWQIVPIEDLTRVEVIGAFQAMLPKHELTEPILDAVYGWGCKKIS